MDKEEHLALAREKAAAVNKGNNYSSKNNRMWADTLRRVLVQSDGEALRRIAEALVAKAQEGDISAIKELGDRIDGKSIATTELSGVDGSSLPLSIGVTFVESISTISQET
jgi:hypothetical protein